MYDYVNLIAVQAFWEKQQHFWFRLSSCREAEPLNEQINWLLAVVGLWVGGACVWHIDFALSGLIWCNRPEPNRGEPCVFHVHVLTCKKCINGCWISMCARGVSSSRDLTVSFVHKSFICSCYKWYHFYFFFFFPASFFKSSQGIGSLTQRVMTTPQQQSKVWEEKNKKQLPDAIAVAS